MFARNLLFAFSITALCMVFSGTASAQTWNKKTTVTFSAPVEIPGVGAQVLPAGVYVFKLLDSLSDRHIVQVFNKDESHVYATILAIPNYRFDVFDAHHAGIVPAHVLPGRTRRALVQSTRLQQDVRDGGVHAPDAFCLLLSDNGRVNGCG